MRGTRLTVKRMCQLGSVSRAGYYRYLQRSTPPASQDRALREAIWKIALQWPAYGSRRITAALRHRGWHVNRKKLQRLMREDNLLCLRKRKFVVTTDSNHGFKVYPNLARDMILTGTDQLWVADITYIRLAEEFVYLAVVLDAYSRRVIGWNLEKTLETRLSLAALEMALRRRSPSPDLVHHSDRGSQYASKLYTGSLRNAGITISMSRKASPWDNAACESFMKTLKQEEVYRTEYRDLNDARRRIGRFLDQVYNQKRLHSALGYLSPAAFERAVPAQSATAQNQRPTG